MRSHEDILAYRREWHRQNRDRILDHRNPDRISAEERDRRKREQKAQRVAAEKEINKKYHLRGTRFYFGKWLAIASKDN